MLRRLLALTIALSFAGLALSAAPAARQDASVAGTVVDCGEDPVPNHAVRLRNAVTGQVAAAGTTGAAGEFLFPGLPAGNHVVEAVGAAGDVVGLSALIELPAGAEVEEIIVVVCDDDVGGLLLFFGSPPGLAMIAAASGIAAFIANKKLASPSR